MRSFKRAVILITLFVIKCVQGIEVAPGSKCSSLCIDQLGADESSPYSSTTVGSMLVCNDWELAGPNATATGEKWRSCLGCESTSAHYDNVSRENDVYWFLYNMKCTVDWCVLGSLGFPKNPTATAAMLACGTVCQGLNAPLGTNLFDGNMNLQYQYCSFDNAAFSQNVGTCIQCLSNVPAARYLVNYLKVLNSSCQQMPPAQIPVSLEIILFPDPSSTSTSSVRSAASTTDLSYPSATSSTTSILSATPSTLSSTPSTIPPNVTTSSHLATWSTASSTNLFFSTSSSVPSLLTISTTSTTSLSTSAAAIFTSPHSSQNIISISVGAAIGSAAALMILALIIFLCIRQQRQVLKRRLQPHKSTCVNSSQEGVADKISDVDWYKPYICQFPVEMDAVRAVNEVAGRPIHELVGSMPQQ